MKFRIYDNTDKKMVYYGGIFGNTAPYKERSTFSQYDSYKEYHEISEPMLSTGLKDKNGNVIFQGDILKDGHGISLVEYSINDYTGSKFCSNYKGNKRTGPSSNGAWALCYFANVKDSEIIGNVYENPELLKEKP